MSKRPPVPFGIARIFTVLITALVWCGILFVAGWIFSGGGRVQTVSPVVMANTAAMALWLVPFFTTQGVLTGMMDGYSQGRFTLPDEAGQPAPSSRSPWLYAFRNAMRLGVVAAAVASVLASRASEGTLTPTAFAMRLAFAGMVLCGITAWQVSGGVYLHETRVPHAQRAYAGTLTSYLLWRHVLPQGVINAVINFAVTYAIFPALVADVAAIAPAEMVVGDTLITLFLLTGIIGAGAMTHARVDAKWGIAPNVDALVPKQAWRVFVPAIAFSIATTAGMGFTLHALGVKGLGAHTWAVWRTVVFGLYPAWLAYAAAKCALARAQ